MVWFPLLKLASLRADAKGYSRAVPIPDYRQKHDRLVDFAGVAARIPTISW